MEWSDKLDNEWNVNTPSKQKNEVAYEAYGAVPYPTI